MVRGGRLFGGRDAARSRTLVPTSSAKGGAASALLHVVVEERPSTDWQQALMLWERQLQSERTRRTYRSAVRQFFLTPGAPQMLQDLTPELLFAYGGALKRLAEKNAPPAERLAPATVNLRLAAMRSFLDFCRWRGWLSPTLPGEVVERALKALRAHVQRPYQIVEGDEELAAMLDAAAADAYDAPRAVALVALTLGAGLRVAELCALDVADISSDATGFFVDVRAGKGWKDRQVPIAPDVHALVLDYVRATGREPHRTADRATPLFVSRKCRSGAGRLTTRSAERIIAACASRAGFTARGKRITPHGLRHSYAIRVLRGDPEHGRAGAPLPAVSKLLGHSSIAVTGRYLSHFERRDLAVYAPTLRRRADG